MIMMTKQQQYRKRQRGKNTIVVVSRSTPLFLLVAVLLTLFLKDHDGITPTIGGNRKGFFSVDGFTTSTTTTTPLILMPTRQRHKGCSMHHLYPTALQSSSKNTNDRQHQHQHHADHCCTDSGRVVTMMPTAPMLWKKVALRSKAVTVATAMVLLVGWSTPAIALPQSSLGTRMAVTSSVLVSDANPAAADGAAGAATGTMEISDIMKSLKPATENRPQIPFPTNEALKRAAEAAASATATASTSSSSSSPPSSQTATTKGATTTTNTKNPFSLRNQQKQQYPVPQENRLRENTYSLPALISLESSATNAERPYNGADVLVLQVWTGRPPSTNANANAEAIINSNSKSIGGAKIPIGAVVGGFPVRVSLGPQNANALPAANNDWNESLSSQSLWVRAAVCRGSGERESVSVSDTGSETIGSRSRSQAAAASSSSCPSEYPTPVLEGIGFSKWIDLSTVVSAATNDAAASNVGSSSSSSSNGGGIRAPVSLVLAVPR